MSGCGGGRRGGGGRGCQIVMVEVEVGVESLVPPYNKWWARGIRPKGSTFSVGLSMHPPNRDRIPGRSSRPPAPPKRRPQPPHRRVRRACSCTGAYRNGPTC